MTRHDPPLDVVLLRLKSALRKRASALLNMQPERFRLDELIDWYVNEAVSACEGSRSMAARVLGVARRTVQRRMAQ